MADQYAVFFLGVAGVVKDIPFRDTRTLIFIYGKPLIAHQDPLETALRASAEGASSPVDVSAPAGRDASLSYRHSGAGAFAGNPLNFYFPGGSGPGGERPSAAPSGVPGPFSRLPAPVHSSGKAADAALLQPVVVSSLAYVRIVDVCVGEQHALFLADSGDVYAYGEGVYGQLGLGYERQIVNHPQKVEGSLSQLAVQQIACGDYHSVALTTEGLVFAWGAADCVGDGSGLCRFSPVRIRLPLPLGCGHFPVDACRVIAARFQQTMAVTEAGHLLVWGDTFFANFHATPEVLCLFPIPVVQIAIGKHFGLALTDDGQVYGWGDGTYGELTAACPMAPMTLPEPLNLKDSTGQSLPPVVAIATGTRHAILLTHDMRLWALGDNLAGQCGVPGHQTRLSVPKMVKLGELRSRASKIACGYRHSACITPNNQLYLWGHSSNHKLIFTAAAEGICEKASQPGVAIRSGLKSACCRARLIYSMLNLKITGAALGSETTVIVTGDGDAGRQSPPAPGASARRAGDMSSRRSKKDSEEQIEARVITAADLSLTPPPQSPERTTSGAGSGDREESNPCSSSERMQKGDTLTSVASSLSRAVWRRNRNSKASGSQGGEQSGGATEEKEAKEETGNARREAEEEAERGAGRSEPEAGEANMREGAEPPRESSGDPEERGKGEETPAGPEEVRASRSAGKEASKATESGDR
ncbi:putative regulator of chromosome condensation domain-containing protein [Neospora caninum Liverpool]|uniref:Putative regulator of chromosome condensation domain-containing protein n=1 Tax=Neospora caninum (strain Liverpool) TaxID=572307 RepID=F0VNG4_NEOCL|nr:putative regulator of chromosome condensation domain-containing protein [Neospora caninum Liverpool]CBZ55260.1 putative regulator of chromosome condensation domain-containing protein [Neospora caninum Liverpool]|eukprot:XP_003885288.1 putative regulator of chromosome condensation domain-containing protein [Neospora caninum Liverpool]